MGKRGVVLNLLSDYDVPLYNRVSDALSRKVPRFDSAMVSENIQHQREEESQERKKKKEDSWLSERPARFVSKVFREEFEIDTDERTL